jgi:hypothetical protein
MFGNTHIIMTMKLFRLFVLLPLSMLVVLAWTATDESIAQLKLDHAALRAAEDDYRAQREFGLDGIEAAEYAGYIARLQRLVFEDCQAVLETGSSLPPDLPCPVRVPQAIRSADISTQQEKTPQEQIAVLDSMLSAGLSEYDEKLLREQERVKAKAPNNNTGNGNGTGDGSSDGTGDSGADGEGQQGEGSQGASSGDFEGEGEKSGGKTGGDQQAGEAGDRQPGGSADNSNDSGDKGNDTDTPAYIPDGSDDDVVARQLREAAEKESDPELKAKLWEEYRRYKRGTS